MKLQEYKNSCDQESENISWIHEGSRFVKRANILGAMQIMKKLNTPAYEGNGYDHSEFTPHDLYWIDEITQNTPAWKGRSVVYLLR